MVSYGCNTRIDDNLLAVHECMHMRVKHRLRPFIHIVSPTLGSPSARARITAALVPETPADCRHFETPCKVPQVRFSRASGCGRVDYSCQQGEGAAEADYMGHLAPQHSPTRLSGCTAMSADIVGCICWRCKFSPASGELRLRGCFLKQRVP